MTPRVGVLALQGDVREHQRILVELGAEAPRVRTPEDLAGVAIPPAVNSTTGSAPAFAISATSS